MRHLFYLVIFSFLSTGLSAQNDGQEESDPQAKALLEAMREKYEAYNSMQAKFTNTYELPGQDEQSENGVLTQQKEKYRLVLDGRTLVSDGTSVWLYVEKNKEVQINDAEEDEGGGISSPQDLLRAYEWDDYVYVLSNEFSENGRVVQQIEFKPTDRDSDYSKIRLTIDKATMDIVRGRAFSKDGTRMTVTLNELKPNVSVSDSAFTFEKSECPDCHFEDLRLN
jgi:outer membrane lipoprotein-sorting protein